MLPPPAKKGHNALDVLNKAGADFEHMTEHMHAADEKMRRKTINVFDHNKHEKERRKSAIRCACLPALPDSPCRLAPPSNARARRCAGAVAGLRGSR